MTSISQSRKRQFCRTLAPVADELPQVDMATPAASDRREMTCRNSINGKLVIAEVVELVDTLS